MSFNFVHLFFLRVHLYSIDISTRVVVRFILAQDLIEDTLSSSILSFRFRQNFHRDLYFLEITFFLYFNNNNTCNVFLRYRICLHIIFQKPGSQKFYNFDRYFLSTIHLDPFPVYVVRKIWNRISHSIKSQSKTPPPPFMIINFKRNLKHSEHADWWYIRFLFKERSTIPDGCFRNRFPQGNFAHLDGTRAVPLPLLPPPPAQGTPSSPSSSSRTRIETISRGQTSVIAF